MVNIVGAGVVIDLVIGDAGMTNPEMNGLARIFRSKLVHALLSVMIITAISAGYLFNRTSTCSIDAQEVRHAGH